MLGHRDEFGGRNETAHRMAPPRQSLKPGNPQLICVEPRLKPHLKSIFPQREPQIAFYLTAFTQRPLHFRVEPDGEASAARLGLVHRGHRMAQKGRRVRAVFRMESQSHARGKPELGAIDQHRIAQCHLDRAGQGLCCVLIRAQHGEFIAADPCQKRARAAQTVQSPADLPQQPVAGIMTQCIVDRFEPVEVQPDQTEPAGGGMFGQFRDALGQQGAIGHAGQRIVMREIADPRLRDPAFRDVRERTDHSATGQKLRMSFNNPPFFV